MKPSLKFANGRWTCMGIFTRGSPRATPDAAFASYCARSYCAYLELLAAK